MLYRLSKVVPVRMHSTYGTEDGPESASWWQWRGRIFRHRTHRLDPDLA